MSNLRKIQDKDWDITIEQFGNFSELIETNDSRKRNFGEARTSTNDRWSGCSYEKAVDLLLHGWDEQIKEINQKISKVSRQGTALKMKQFNDVHGFVPIVPNAIKGIPQSMINMNLQPKKAKVIYITTDLGVACYVSTNDVIEYVKKLASKIIQLEKNGFRVRLTFYKSFNNYSANKSYALKMLLKNEYQPLDLKRILFALGHPAMFRRICFDWYERLPGAQEFDGHGYSMHVVKKNTRDKFEKYKELICDKNEYLICYGDDLEEMFKNAK